MWVNGEFQLNGSKVEQIIYNKTNVLPGSTATAFNPRDTNMRIMTFDHFNKGIFEQGILLRTTLDATINITVLIGADWDGTGFKNGPNIWTGTAISDSRFFFLSDISSTVVNNTYQKIINLVELRLPLPQITFQISAQTVPTTGDISMMVTRRY